MLKRTLAVKVGGRLGRRRRLRRTLVGRSIAAARTAEHYQRSQQYKGQSQETRCIVRRFAGWPMVGGHRMARFPSRFDACLKLASLLPTAKPARVSAPPYLAETT